MALADIPHLETPALGILSLRDLSSHPAFGTHISGLPDFAIPSQSYLVESPDNFIPKAFEKLLASLLEITYILN